MLVYFHRGFIMEGEATFKERKHFWSKPEKVRRKIHCKTGIYGICDDSELEQAVEKHTQEQLKSSGWGEDFSGWQRLLTYEEGVDLAKREKWETDFTIPKNEVTTKTLDNWTVSKAAKELNGKQFAQYCRDYGITINENMLNE